MINLKNKKAAMEMSMGTIVTIVLLMSVLVLGIFMVQNIFEVSEGAVDSIGTATEDQIDQLFSDEGRSLVLTPQSGEISIKQGGDTEGFGFRINNMDIEPHSYTYELSVSFSDEELARSCGSAITTDKANNLIMSSTGEVRELGPGQSMKSSKIIRFNVPEKFPKCDIQYELEILEDGTYFDAPSIFLTIK